MRETKVKTEKGEEVKTTIWPFQSDSCMACWNMPLTADERQTAPRAHGIVVSLPVFLIEKSGETTIVCYVARCVNCGTVKHYGAIPGIFKMPLVKPDTNIGRWPEILRNDIDPVKFEEAILNSPKGKVWLNAKDLQKKIISRERAAFYEPIYAGRM
jgi:hypothetical protein